MAVKKDKDEALLKRLETVTEQERPAWAAHDYIKGDYDNIVMLGHPMIDSLMQVVFALGAEIWTGQQRMRIIESLMASEGRVTPEMIERYQPSEAEEAEWAAARKAMVDRLYGVIATTNSSAAPFGSPPSHREAVPPE